MPVGTIPQSVPGTLFFQSPGQGTNIIELLVNVTQNAEEVEFFEDFYIEIARHVFALQPRGDLHAEGCVARFTDCTTRLPDGLLSCLTQ